MAEEETKETLVEQPSAPSARIAPAELIRVHAHNRLLLLLMIKNESAIIERCLAHAVQYVDAVSILDTGSTDDTVQRCEAFLANTQKPFRIETHPFKNFGETRTVSFENAQRHAHAFGWDTTTSYALAVDADMVIKPQPAFFQYPLTQNGYHLIQENGHLKYYNLRLMRLSHPWKCIGGTHEYWSGDPTEKIPYEVFYIDDKNDGGCKADKFERDVRLLRADIEADPQNARAYFYLGQSLKDLGRFDEAIERFQKRIDLGGWVEEVWYSMLQIGRCYDHKGDEGMMEYWMNKAFTFHPKRAEPLYHLTRYFREKSQHWKAYHYYLKGRDIPYPSNDVLFIEKQVYEGMFDYEKTILACYVHPSPHSKLDSQVEIIKYLNTYPHYHQNVFDNLVWYAPPLLGPVYDGEYTPLLVPPHGPKENLDEYQASSCSLVPHPSTDGFLMNARLVNYRIDERGCYHMRSVSDQNVRTKNALLQLDKDYRPVALPRVLEEVYERHPTNIEGLEDMRLFYHEGTLRFIASSKDATPLGKIVIVTGEYDAEAGRAHSIKVLEPPRPSTCEKNWVYVSNDNLQHVPQAKGRMNFIFGFHPLQIGAIVPEEADTYHGKLEIHTVQETPTFWTHFRGSSPLVEYKGKLYAVVHHVKYNHNGPRQYLHTLVEFSREMRAVRYTPFFCFRKTAIEYCIGLDVAHEVATFAFSENDASPGMVQVPFSKFRWLNV
jgi:tetratricopeptide (TPR) repeat protein